MTEYIHHISIPFAGTLLAKVKSDQERPDPETLHRLFQDQHTGKLAIITIDGMQPEVDGWSTYTSLVTSDMRYIHRLRLDATEVVTSQQ